MIIEEQRGVDERTLLETFEDDVDGAPWMVVSDAHARAVTAILDAIRYYKHRERLDWYVSSELAVAYRRPSGRNGQVAPDVLVAFVEDRLRDSFKVAREGVFPQFVVEVVSRESRTRDPGRKAQLYGLLGAEEYAIFDPAGLLDRPLQGYRRGPHARWEQWPLGGRGELVSAVLGLTLLPDGDLLRLRDPGGVLLPTGEEIVAALAAAQARAEAAEAEVARLRARLGNGQATTEG